MVRKLFAAFVVIFAQSVSAACEELPSRLAVDGAYTFGRRLEAEGLFDEAITEYLRAYCFNDDPNVRCHLLYAIGMCHARLDEWGPAVAALEQSLPLCRDERAVCERILTLAQVRIASRDYSGAEADLLVLAEKTGLGSMRKRALFFLGVVYTYRHEWEKAHARFDDVFADESNLPIRERFATAFAVVDIAGHRSPDVARALSFVVPGLGQLYSGRPLDALGAFVINTGLATWIAFLAASGDWLDAAAVFNFLFLRFYMGNVSNAARFAREYDRGNEDAAVRSILTIALDVEPH